MISTAAINTTAISTATPNPGVQSALSARFPGTPPAVPLREVLALLPVGVLLLDGKGKVQDANPVAIELLGVPLLGQRWRDVITRSFEPRADDGYEVSLRDGRRVQIATRAMSDGVGQLIVITDLSETRQLQARLAQRDRLASIGHLMASLAHQLRTPISSALLCAHQLQRQSTTDVASARHAARVIERLQHMERQIADMLLVAGGGSPKVESIVVDELLDRLFELYVPLAKQHGITLIRDGRLPGGCVIGNRDALNGALGNLLDNAFHACQQRGMAGQQRDTPERNAPSEKSTQPPGVCAGQVTLQLALQGSDRIVLAIADNGCGMSPAVMARLREPFFTTKRTGTGLGLAVVQAVIESHQGELAISSEPGKGSRFALSLPLTAALAQAV